MGGTFGPAYLAGPRLGATSGSAALNGKIARIEAMLSEGWVVEDIVSDHGAIEVLLAKEASRATVVLDRIDAYEVLHGDAFEGTWRPSPRATLVVER